jgi:hypothetical protein
VNTSIYANVFAGPDKNLKFVAREVSCIVAVRQIKRWDLIFLLDFQRMKYVSLLENNQGQHIELNTADWFTKDVVS